MKLYTNKERLRHCLYWLCIIPIILPYGFVSVINLAGDFYIGLLKKYILGYDIDLNNFEFYY